MLRIYYKFFFIIKAFSVSVHVTSEFEDQCVEFCIHLFKILFSKIPILFHNTLLSQRV